MKYEVIIGLEIHLQLKTKSKMFCDSPNVGGEAPPNTAVCPVCMGHPGTLPVINAEAVRQGMRMALALKSAIASETRFDRKNYFYPDLPKGYQISQFDTPLATGGFVTILVKGRRKKLSLERLHLEEDAGKIFHRAGKTLVDFNRAGTPLAEIVSNPELRTPEEARLFLQELRLIARYLGVSDADMEKGQLRCDANISLRPLGKKKLYPKIEIKNLNSFKAVERALTYEISRQTELWNKDQSPQKQETRGWDESKQETVLQRSKEGFDDYRYFPEPDLKPLHISREDIDRVAATIPELPEAKRKRLTKEYALTEADIGVLVSSKANAEFFEEVVEELKNWLFDVGGGKGTKEHIWKQHKKKITKLALSWITTDLFKHLNSDKKQINEIQITPENMAELIVMIYEAKINSSAAQLILDKMYHEGRDPSDIAKDESLFQVSDESDLRNLVMEVIAQNQVQVQQYVNGKQSVFKYLVGMVMKLSRGSANPQVVAKLLKEALTKLD